MAEDRKRSANPNTKAIPMVNGRAFSRATKGNQAGEKPAIDLMESD